MYKCFKKYFVYIIENFRFTVKCNLYTYPVFDEYFKCNFFLCVFDEYFKYNFFFMKYSSEY